ncbi:MAG: Hypothetical protein AJITA_00800 [Acetilactobacillus jinshanensis]
MKYILKKGMKLIMISLTNCCCCLISANASHDQPAYKSSLIN